MANSVNAVTRGCDDQRCRPLLLLSVLRSCPPSSLVAAVDDTTTSKQKVSSSLSPSSCTPVETDESSAGSFVCSFSGDDFGDELPPIFTNFDLLSDFVEALMAINSATTPKNT